MFGKMGDSGEKKGIESNTRIRELLGKPLYHFGQIESISDREKKQKKGMENSKIQDDLWVEQFKFLTDAKVNQVACGACHTPRVMRDVGNFKSWVRPPWLTCDETTGPWRFPNIGLVKLSNTHA